MGFSRQEYWSGVCLVFYTLRNVNTRPNVSFSLDYKLQEIMDVFSFIHCKFHAQHLGQDKFSVIIPCLNEWAQNNCTLTFRKVSFPFPQSRGERSGFKGNKELSISPCQIVDRYTLYWGFLGGSSGKEPACQCRSCKTYEFNPWIKKIHWSRKWQPFQYSCLENPMDRGAWQATVYRVAKSKTQLKQLLTLLVLLCLKDIAFFVLQIEICGNCASVLMPFF